MATLPKVALTAATLDEARGNAALGLARATAGLACDSFLAIDTENEGGCRTANRVWKQALASGCDYLAYINDDVYCEQEGWLARLVEVLEGKPEYGIAGAGGRCATAPQSRGRPGLEPKVEECRLLSFFCVVIKRAVLNEIGVFDEAYFHFGCDTEYCEVARRAGWTLVWVRDVYVRHEYMEIGHRPTYVQRWKRHDAQLYLSRWRGKD